MSFETVAKRYAQAIFELGVEGSSVASLTDELKRVAQAYESSADLRGMAENPLVSEGDRQAVIDEIAARMGLSATAKNTIGLLAQRRRLAVLPAIAKELGHLADERAGIVRGTVTSAGALNEAYFQKLQREVERVMGKKVLLERHQDPSLIAGVVVKIGDRIIDGSARARLDHMREQLLSS